MAHRLAIAISGAVSLGAYEAGVMYEVIRAIGQHNQQANENEQILIEVITGASTGGMTAAILAQKLLFEANRLEDPENNHLYAPWVQMADVEGLLKKTPYDRDDQSIISSRFIAGIAEDYLLKRLLP